MLSGQRILIVGGAGFVGSNLVRRCVGEGAAKIVVVDNLLSSAVTNLPQSDAVELRVGSIADSGILRGLEDTFDVVYHLATFHGNQNSIADPLADHENSLSTTVRLYEHLKGFERLRRLVYVSTGCSLAKNDSAEVSEVVEADAVSLDFDSPYQISKVAGEMFSIYYNRQEGLPVVRARFQNVYGPGEVLGAGEWRGTEATVWRNVVPAFIYRALRGMPLLVHGKGEGGRDFIYVDDIVQGLLLCGTAAHAEGQVFNLASGKVVEIRELATKIIDLTGSAAGIEWLPMRSWDRSFSRCGSTVKSREILGFDAEIDFVEGLTRTVEWTRRNLSAIDASIARHSVHMKMDARRAAS